MRKQKNLLILALICCLILGLSACGGEEGGITDTVSNAASDAVDKVSKMLSAQGREYDELYTGEIGETMTNSFFDFTLNSVETATELAGYTPTQEGYKFVVANVTVKNVFDQDIPVGNYDFNIIWGTDTETGGEDYAFESFMEGMYPDDITLAPGETASGDVVFEIPEAESTIGIVYYEIWDDDFVGNTYVFNVDLDSLTAA